MGEDRRSNVGGRPAEEEPRPDAAASTEDLRRRAELLAARRGVDGHEQKREKDEESGPES